MNVKLNENFNRSNFYIFEDAFNLIKSLKKKKIKENINVSIKLDIIPKNKDINIKGFSCLPNSIGKNYKIAVFSTEKNFIEFEKYKIEFFDEKKIKNLNKKNINFDIIITDPKSIIKLGSISKILNSKKIMPDILYNTITTNILDSIEKIGKNYIQFKNNKSNTINCMIGEIDLKTSELKENLENLIKDIKKSKPKNCKIIRIKDIYLSSTMSCGIKININSLNI